MIKKMNAAEQELVAGGNGYKKLSDGRVLIYLTDDDRWEIFENEADAMTVMRRRCEYIGFFEPISISEEDAWEIATELENRESYCF